MYSHQVAALEELQLVNCTAPLAPLFIASSMPKLKRLELEASNAPDSLELDLKPLAQLEALSFKSCSKVFIKVKHMLAFCVNADLVFNIRELTVIDTHLQRTTLNLVVYNGCKVH